MEALCAIWVVRSDGCAARRVVDEKVERARGRDAEHLWKALRMVTSRREAPVLTLHSAPSVDTNTMARSDE